MPEALLEQRRQRRVHRVLEEARVAPRGRRADAVALDEQHRGAGLGEERGDRAADDPGPDDGDVGEPLTASAKAHVHAAGGLPAAASSSRAPARCAAARRRGTSPTACRRAGGRRPRRCSRRPRSPARSAPEPGTTPWTYKPGGRPRAGELRGRRVAERRRRSTPSSGRRGSARSTPRARSRGDRVVGALERPPVRAVRARGRVDADEPAVEVDQRPAREARVERGVGADRVGVGRHVGAGSRNAVRAAETTPRVEDAGSPASRGLGEAEREHGLALRAAVASSSAIARRARTAGDAQEREVLARGDADDLRLGRAGGRADEEALPGVDDVRGGHDQPLAAVEHPAAAEPAARADAARLDPHGRRRDVAQRRPATRSSSLFPASAPDSASTSTAAIAAGGHGERRVGQPPPAPRARVDEPPDHRPRRALGLGRPAGAAPARGSARR